MHAIATPARQTDTMAPALGRARQADSQTAAPKFSHVLTIVAVVVWALSAIGGIILGNAFATVDDYGYGSTFNVGVAVAGWFTGFLQGLLFFALGRIAAMLERIVPAKDATTATPPAPAVFGPAVD
jgi:hypothetical protein